MCGHHSRRGRRLGLLSVGLTLTAAQAPLPPPSPPPPSPPPSPPPPSPPHGAILVHSSTTCCYDDGSNCNSVPASYQGYITFALCVSRCSASASCTVFAYGNGANRCSATDQCRCWLYDNTQTTCSVTDSVSRHYDLWCVGACPSPPPPSPPPSPPPPSPPASGRCLTRTTSTGKLSKK